MVNNRLITRMLMGIAITFGTSTTANAQLGGLLNKAKKAAKSAVENTVSDSKEKVEESVSNTVEENSEPSQSSFNTNTGVDYSVAKATKWDAYSNWATIRADLAYNLANLKNSLKAGSLDKIDFQSYLNAYIKSPGFSVMMDCFTEEADVEKWKNEMSAVNERYKQIAEKGFPKRGDDRGKYAEDVVKFFTNKAKACKSNAAKEYFLSDGIDRLRICFLAGYIEKTDSRVAPLLSEIESVATAAGIRGKLPSPLNADAVSNYVMGASDPNYKEQYNLVQLRRCIAQKGLMMPKPGSCNTAEWKNKGVAEVKKLKNHQGAILKAVVSQSDWRIQYNPNKTPKCRWMNVYVICKEAAAEKFGYYVVHDVSFVQDYQGGGKYGATRLNSTDWQGKYVEIKDYK